jgi:hypothetical protein
VRRCWARYVWCAQALGGIDHPDVYYRRGGDLVTAALALLRERGQGDLAALLSECLTVDVSTAESRPCAEEALDRLMLIGTATGFVEETRGCLHCSHCGSPPPTPHPPPPSACFDV